MKQPKICTIVTGSTIGEFITNLKHIQTVSDLVELRTDYIYDMQLEYVKQIKNALKVKAIFTCRLKAYGGKFNEQTNTIDEILQLANDIGFDYIDIDLGLYDCVQIKDIKSKVIVSYHDFYETPNQRDLNKIKRRMFVIKADIYKYAFKINNDNDKKKIYKLILNNKDKDIIAIGMGKLGRETRIIAPLLGSYLTFASTEYGESASGQIDVNELNKIYNLINMNAENRNQG